jgi:hypothetical protein
MRTKTADRPSTGEAEPQNTEPCKVVGGNSALPRVKLSSFTGTFWSCDGPCTTASRSYRELHFCRICNDTCFCEECFKLVKENKLPYRHCSAEHEWVQAFPVPKGTKDLAATIREGYVELHQEWLIKLREQWTK